MNIFIIFIFSSHLCCFDIMFHKYFIPISHIPMFYFCFFLLLLCPSILLSYSCFFVGSIMSQSSLVMSCKCRSSSYHLSKPSNYFFQIGLDFLYVFFFISYVTSMQLQTHDKDLQFRSPVCFHMQTHGCDRSIITIHDALIPIHLSMYNFNQVLHWVETCNFIQPPNSLHDLLHSSKIISIHFLQIIKSYVKCTLMFS